MTQGTSTWGIGLPPPEDGSSVTVGDRCTSEIDDKPLMLLRWRWWRGVPEFLLEFWKSMNSLLEAAVAAVRDGMRAPQFFTFSSLTRSGDDAGPLLVSANDHWLKAMDQLGAYTHIHRFTYGICFSMLYIWPCLAISRWVNSWWRIGVLIHADTWITYIVAFKMTSITNYNNTWCVSYTTWYQLLENIQQLSEYHSRFMKAVDLFETIGSSTRDWIIH